MLRYSLGSDCHCAALSCCLMNTQSTEHLQTASLCREIRSVQYLSTHFFPSGIIPGCRSHMGRAFEGGQIRNGLFCIRARACQVLNVWWVLTQSKSQEPSVDVSLSGGRDWFKIDIFESWWLSFGNCKMFLEEMLTFHQVASEQILFPKDLSSC